jgi:hypothetical protein
MRYDMRSVRKQGAETTEYLLASKKKPKAQTFSGENRNGKQHSIRGWQLYADAFDCENKEAGWYVCETTILGDDGTLYHRRTPHYKEGDGVVTLWPESVFMTDRILERAVEGLKKLAKSVA